MRKQVLGFILTTLFVFGLASTSFARSKGSSVSFAPRRQLATIVFSGLGGAVLGLSTLSFYGEPQEHLDNIGTGFAVGIIAGTFFVTYSVLNYSYVEPFPHKLKAEPEMFTAQKAVTPLSWQWNF